LGEVEEAEQQNKPNQIEEGALDIEAEEGAEDIEVIASSDSFIMDIKEFPLEDYSTNILIMDIEEEGEEEDTNCKVT